MGLFEDVKETKGGIKVLAYGGTGTGKTSFALTFPEIVAIDTEDGMRWYLKNPNLLKRLTTTSADTVEEAMDEVEEELVGKFSTFVLDSETKVYENMQHSALALAEKRARTKGQSVDDANISQREWGKIKLITKRIQASKITLASQGINVVSIAQEKELKEKKGENFVVVGYAPDTSKGMEYDYDIVLRLFTKEDKEGNVIYYAEVKKDRTNIFKRGDIIEDPSYEYWREVVEGVAELETTKIDFKGDIDRDFDKMKTEIEELEDIMGELKTAIKSLKDKKPLMAKCKELKIENPLKIEEVSLATELLEFIKTL